MPAPRNFGRIGPYTLLGTIAEGAMARVFLAHRDDSDDECMCVLKQLHLEVEEEHATASIRIQREALISKKLHHPNIAEVRDAGFEAGRFFIAMEFIPGQTLDDVSARLAQREETMPEELCVLITREVLEGLAYAHALEDDDGRRFGLVHRDLSPRNIMIGFDGSVKIIDFGVAHANLGEDDFQTSPGVLVGTLAYMSPEQALTLEVDQRSDLYSIAVVLYELLAGAPLLPLGAPSEMIRRVVREAPPSILTVNPLVPVPIDRVLTRALMKPPAERYQRATDFRDALVGAYGDLPSRPALAAFMRGLFRDEQQQTKWLLDAAQGVRAARRNFFEDTIEDRFDRVVGLDRRDSSIWSLEKTEHESSISAPDPTTEEVLVRAAIDRYDSDTEPGLPPDPIPVPLLERSVETQIRSLEAHGEIELEPEILALDELLLLLHESRFTGAVDVGGPPEMDRIFFRGGAVVGVSANRKFDAQLFSNALVDLGAVSTKALSVLPRGLKDLDAYLLGRYLLEKGLIDEDTLDRARAEQARRRLYHLFFEQKDARITIRSGLERLKSFFPTHVDIRPVVAYGMVICADVSRKTAIVERMRNKRVRLLSPYDEQRNSYGLPPPIVEALRHLQHEGLELNLVPMLPGLDPMTTAGVLLLLERTSLISLRDPSHVVLPS